MRSMRSIFAIISMAVVTPVMAHTGQHHASGFAAGFAHPLMGMDHVLAMASVGLFAALLGGRAVWSVPASFIGMMLVGGGLGMAGTGIPAVEAGIAASVIVLGALVAWGKPWPPAVGMVIVGFFAVFHGYAHGTEIPTEAGGLGYSAGFALASLTLHTLGLAAGMGMLRQGHAVRISGLAVTLVGVWVTFG